MKYKTILEVRNISRSSSGVLWCVHHRREDGLLWDYAFPGDSLHNLSAEYGIHPMDADTLLEVYLYQFHMDPTALHESHPHFVWNTDEATARFHHLARVESLKQDFQYRDPNGLLDQIKQHHLNTFSSSRHSQRVKLAASLRSKRLSDLAWNNR